MPRSISIFGSFARDPRLAYLMFRVPRHMFLINHGLMHADHLIRYVLSEVRQDRPDAIGRIQVDSWGPTPSPHFPPGPSDALKSFVGIFLNGNI